MTDELEKKLLEEIKQLGGHFDDALHARLSQHRATKKWILEDEIRFLESLPDWEDNLYYSNISDRLEELKKQISGEGK